MKQIASRNIFLISFILILPWGIGSVISPANHGAFAQSRDQSLWTFCVMNGNNISTLVYNYGTIGHNLNHSPSWEWPRLKDPRYGNEFGFILGAEVPNDVTDDPNDFIHVITQSMEESRGTDAQGWDPQPGWHKELPLPEGQEGSLATYNRPETWGDKFPQSEDGEALWPGQFGAGIRVADFECIYKMDDRDHKMDYYAFPPDYSKAGLGVEVTVRGYQFSPLLAADMMFFQYEMKNVSKRNEIENINLPINLEKLVVGIMGDPLLGGPGDGSDDRVDVVKDSDLIFYWDNDNTTPAFKGDVGYMGFQFIETPKDENGKMLGLTSYSAIRVHRLDPADTGAMWKALTPGYAQMDQPADNLLLMGSAYFRLPIDSSQKLTLLGVFAITEEELLDKVTAANIIYENDFKYLIAPDSPKVKATAGDGSVTIEWDESAEESYDPLFKKDFEGYLIYRSTDGEHWGEPIAQFDSADGIKGYHTASIKDKLFFLGNDTGLQHSFTDNALINGITYYYAVTAYDSGSSKGGIPPLESAKFLSNQNVIKVTPRTNPTRKLDDIAVVPNPYIATSLFDSPVNPNAMGTYSGRRIMFINLPPKCSIRIYTVTGELVQTIEHDANSGDESWDLLNYDGLNVASGTYLYHVEAPGVGEKIGRLSIIK